MPQLFVPTPVPSASAQEPPTALLSSRQLDMALLPLRRDYAATLAAVADRPDSERATALQERIAAYSRAFSSLFIGALDDAAGVR